MFDEEIEDSKIEKIKNEKVRNFLKSLNSIREVQKEYMVKREEIQTLYWKHGEINRRLLEYNRLLKIAKRNKFCFSTVIDRIRRNIFLTRNGIRYASVYSSITYEPSIFLLKFLAENHYNNLINCARNILGETSSDVPEFLKKFKNENEKIELLKKFLNAVKEIQFPTSISREVDLEIILIESYGSFKEFPVRRIELDTSGN